MIGMILCGHGNFATGLGSSLKLIVGSQENFAFVDFTEGMSSEELAEDLEKAVTEVDSGAGVVIFTDIPGGTPFNQSVQLAVSKENVRVIGGTNLPSLLDSCFKRQLSLDDFVNGALSTGKDGLKTFEKKRVVAEEEDGI